MAIEEVLEGYTDTGKLVEVGSVVGGYLVTEQVTLRGQRFLESLPEQDFDLPDELSGLVTAGAFYGYGEMIVSENTADHMAYGALIHSVDTFTDRPSVRSALPLTGE